MEKIKRLKESFKREKIDGYLIQKMMNFLENTYLITMIGSIIFLTFQVLMVFR